MDKLFSNIGGQFEVTMKDSLIVKIVLAIIVLLVVFFILKSI